MQFPGSLDLALASHLRRGRQWALPLATLSLLAAGAVAPHVSQAQLPQARLASFHPAGGQAGQPVEVTVAGTDLDEATGLVFNHPGITAAPKTQMVDGKPQPIANVFAITIAGDVPPGVYDLRVKGLFGLSNPRTFTVVDRKSVAEIEPNNTPDKAASTELNTVIFARSDAASDVDWYKLTLPAGKRILVEARAGRVDSRMEPVVELYSGTRRLLRRAQVGRSDVVLDFTAPAAGDYLLRVYDRVFAGSAEYGYQLKIHDGPRVEFALPASGVAGSTAEYTLYGSNLPGGQPAPLKGADGRPLEMLKAGIGLPGDPTQLNAAGSVRPEASGVDAFSYIYRGANGSATPVDIFYSSAPTTLLEVEPNDTVAQVQKIAVPVELTGQFQNRRDTDLFQFEAKAGEVFTIELFGQRNGNPSDPTFALDSVKVDDKGMETLTRVTVGEDNPLNLGGALFNTATDDPVFRFAVPADGTYRLTVRDRYFENRGDAGMVYRLAIRRETPDFRLVAMPVFPNPDPNTQPSTWEVSLRKGDSAHLMVMAHRRDGFAGDIVVTAEGLPAGVTTAGAILGPGVNSAMLVLKSAENAAEFAGPIKIVGRARVASPAQVKAVADAEAARLAAVQALPALVKGVTDAEAALKPLTEAAAKAKEALDKDANNDGLKKAKADADAAVAKATEALKTATDNRTAGEKKIVDSNAAVQTARQQRDQAPEVAREARGGTIVWNGNPGAQQAAESRVAHQVALAVLKDVAPFQVNTEALKFSVNAGSQILIPISVVKRAGFDNPVTLNFVAPLANAQVENKPIPKGEAAGVYRIYLPNNVAVGSTTFFLQGTAQVTYSRNPEAAAAAAKEKEAADKTAVEKAELAKKAADAKVVADKKATDTTAEAKKAADAKVAADKLAVDTAAAAKTAADEKVVTDKAVVDADAAHKAALEAQAKATEALNKDANNDGLKKAKADADANVVKAAEALKKAQDAKVAADKKAADTAEAAKKAADAKVVADKAAVDTDTAAKKAAEEKVAADKLAAETDAASKAAAAAKAAADKKATDTANAAKPTTPNVFPPAAGIMVTVRPAPGTLAVAVANGGALKRGATVEAKVTLTRANGFTGPVTLSLPLPPNVAGLSAAPVVIPADKTEGTLVIQAAGDATMGQLANLVVRASMEFDGQSAIDQPIAINVQQ